MHLLQLRSGLQSRVIIYFFLQKSPFFHIMNYFVISLTFFSYREMAFSIYWVFHLAKFGGFCRFATLHICVWRYYPTVSRCRGIEIATSLFSTVTISQRARQYRHDFAPDPSSGSAGVADERRVETQTSTSVLVPLFGQMQLAATASVIFLITVTQIETTQFPL